MNDAYNYGYCPEVRDQSPVFDVKDLFGTPLSVGRTLVAGRSTLLLFMHPDNGACAKLMPVLQSIVAREGVDVVLISDDNDADHHRFLNRHQLDGMRYVVSSDVSQRFQANKTPYGVLLNPQGVITAKGPCTTRKHVENLFKTRRLGYYSLQGYLSKVPRHAKLANEFR